MEERERDGRAEKEEKEGVEDDHSKQDFDFLAEGDADAHGAKQYTAQFDLEQWYDELRDQTFPTAFLPLSAEEARAIILVQDLRLKEGHLGDEAAARKTLERLEVRIDEAIGKFTLDDGGDVAAEQEVKPQRKNKTEKHNNKEKGKEKGSSEDGNLDTRVKKKKDAKKKNVVDKERTAVFVRLSTRSPKDAVLNSPRLYEALQEELADVPDAEADENEDLIAWYIAAIKAMRVYNGKEALALLLKSLRVYTDLSRWLIFPEEFAMNIIIRRWTFIHPSLEFRGFVYQGRLNAVSQYIDCCYFESLAESKERYRDLIASYFDSVKATIPMKNYVIDFGIVENDVVRIIELNPFYIKTGASLFNWHADRSLLTRVPMKPRRKRKAKKKPKEKSEQPKSKTEKQGGKKDTSTEKGRKQAAEEDFEFRIIERPDARRMQGFMNVRKDLKENLAAQSEQKAVRYS